MIVSEGVLFGSSKAHKDLRRILVEDQPPRRHRPYCQVGHLSRTRGCRRLSCCSPRPIRVARSTSGSTTSQPMASVWTTSGPTSYRKIAWGRCPTVPLTDHGARQEQPPRTRWPAGPSVRSLGAVTTLAPTRASASPRPTSLANGYDLSINRYKLVVHDMDRASPPVRDHRRPPDPRRRDQESLDELEARL